jgi:glycosyltransferase involved in cell wall biosynthesis
VDQEAPKLLSPLVKIFLSWMKKWDYKGAQRVNYFIANSLEVQKRIKEYYHRDSKIIYPFIDVSFWQTSEPSKNSDGKKRDYFLLAGRLQAHKKNDLIVEAFNELGLPLHVVGTGRQEEYLKSIAQQNVSFYGKVSDEELRKQYAGALAFIYPQVEDFGIMPLEAAACGTPTLAFAKGGSLETVVAGQTGDFFYSYDKEEIKRAIRSWQPEKYNLETLQSQAKKFSKEQFKIKFVNQIESICQ